MRLYHFTTEQYGLEAIRDSRLKLAMINELNDPFEFLGISLPGRTNRDSRKNLRLLKKAASDIAGLICMSRNWHEPLLWSHYADKHHGLCLGFDCPSKSLFLQLDYVDERPTLQDLGVENLSDFNVGERDKILETVLRTKFQAWKYEAEYRRFCRLDDCDPVSDLYFRSFSSDMRLVQIVVGARSSVTRERLKRCLGDRADAVQVFKARSGFKEFKVVENKSESAWR